MSDIDTLIKSLTFFHPAWFLMVCGFVFLAFPRKVFAVLAVATPIFASLVAYSHYKFYHKDILHLLDLNLVPLYFHQFSIIFVAAFLIALFFGVVFALGSEQSQKEICIAFIYAGSAIGLVLAGDLISFFIMWEVMAISAVMIVFLGGSKESGKAGMRYILIHLLGGALLLAGITLKIKLTMSIEFPHYDVTLQTLRDFHFYQLNDLASLLFLTGVLINIGAPPFSGWISDAYPKASAVGTVFLSSYTTKASVFILLTCFAGSEILIYFGSFMIIYGILYSLMENDIRKILTYSLINQVGFMVVAAGLDNYIGHAGAALHAFAHIVYKSLLFMSAASVIFITGKSKATELGGLYKTMPISTFAAIIGGVAISAVPFTSGYISKSVLSVATSDYPALHILFIGAGAGVLLHAGVKFPWFVFFSHDSGIRAKDPPMMMVIAMVAMSVLCIIPGFAPELMYNLLEDPITVNAYTKYHLTNQFSLLIFAGVAFFLMLPLLKRKDSISLDWDWFYRVFALRVLGVFRVLAQFIGKIFSNVYGFFNSRMHTMLEDNYSEFGTMSKARPSSFTIYMILVCFMIIFGILQLRLLG